MTTHPIRKALRGGHVVALLLALVGASCSLDKVDIPEALVGPAELGLSLRLTATPDWVVADDISTSDIVATLRDQNGNVVAGRTIVFAIQDETGNYVSIGGLSSPTAVTDGSGNARVRYVAPARMHILADTEVFIAARLSSTDAAGESLRRVKIQIVASERPLYPSNPNNALPTCAIVTRPVVGPYAVGQYIDFEAAASDADGTIIRYEWAWGDGSYGSGINTTHAYFSAANYSVTLTVIDNNGGIGTCSKALVVK